METLVVVQAYGLFCLQRRGKHGNNFGTQSTNEVTEYLFDMLFHLTDTWKHKNEAELYVDNLGLSNSELVLLRRVSYYNNTFMRLKSEKGSTKPLNFTT